MISTIDIEANICAAAHLKFKVTDLNTVENGGLMGAEMDGELLLLIRQETFYVPPSEDSFITKAVNLFDSFIGKSDDRKAGVEETDDKEPLGFKGRRFYDVTVRVPTFRAPTIHELFMRTVKATDGVAKSYKFNVSCELAPGKLVGLNGCFVKQAPFLHSSVIPNSLVVPLAVDYIDAPEGLLDRFKIEEPIIGT